MKTHLFIVEGSHDVAFLGRILKDVFKYEQKLSDDNLSEFCEKCLPKGFPFYFKEKNLDIFNVVPTFWELGESQICCINANGQENLLTELDDIIISSYDQFISLGSVTVFADADTLKKDAKINYLKENIKERKLTHINTESFIEDKIIVNKHKFKKEVNLFIFPNNKDTGSIEDVIIKGLNESDIHNNSLKLATTFVDGEKQWSSENSKREKAIIGCIGNVYCAGMSNSVIIGNKKVKWLNEDTKKSDIKPLIDFLKSVLGE